MREVSKGEGRTILFVSHNMSAVQKLCNNVMFLNHGLINSIGQTQNIIAKYLHNSEVQTSVFNIPRPADHEDMLCFASKLQIEDIHGTLIREIPVGKPWQIRVYFKINKRMEHFIIAFGISSSTEVNIRTTWSNKFDLDDGYYEAVFMEDELLLSPGCYVLGLGLSNYERSVHYIENAGTITIADLADPILDKSIVRINNVGLILNPMSIAISKIAKTESDQ